MKTPSQTLRIGAAAVIILGTIIYLAITGVQADKSYYVTIGELQAMGNKAYTRHLRVAGDVAAHSIERSGTNAKFVLSEQGHTLRVSYQGVEPPPDTSACAAWYSLSTATYYPGYGGPLASTASSDLSWP